MSDFGNWEHLFSPEGGGEGKAVYPTRETLPEVRLKMNKIKASIETDCTSDTKEEDWPTWDSFENTSGSSDPDITVAGETSRSGHLFQFKESGTLRQMFARTSPKSNSLSRS